MGGSFEFWVWEGNMETTFEQLAENEQQMYARVRQQADDTNRRFGSYVPVRNNCHAKWFIDGKSYFEALADVLETAKSEIFITDWSLNPELFLRRTPGKSSLEDRLDRILLRKAKEGVFVYILVWYEVELAMAGSVNSLHAITTLESLHENIRVLRHPGGKTKVYWTHHQKTVVVDQQHAFIGGIDLCFGRYDSPDHPLVDDCHLFPEFPGKDYYNPEIVEFNRLEEPFIDMIDRTNQPRMPWHDIHAYVDREAARDIGLNFIERWNHHLGKKLQAGTTRVRAYPKLTLATTPFLDSVFPAGASTCQIVRSVGPWSCGVEIERSIQSAYQDMIEKAEHYIYIENQYFISVENTLTDTLFQRISKAIHYKETFRVIIILPITPCGDWMASSIKFVMKWQYDTISRGGNSLLERLQARFPSVVLSNYISFYSLRRGDILNGCPVTSQVYIHSKLMIVDDRRVIIGSANYNDRSMNGDRDSEICVVVEDNQFVESTMNGKFFLASKFAHSLRVNLFLEHLGLSDPSLVTDPVSVSTYERLWRNTAASNGRIFFSIFPDTPHDMYSTISKFKETCTVLSSIEEKQSKASHARSSLD